MLNFEFYLCFRLTCFGRKVEPFFVFFEEGLNFGFFPGLSCVRHDLVSGKAK